MNLRLAMVVVWGCLAGSALVTRGEEAYASVDDAFQALFSNPAKSLPWGAVEYLAQHPQESTPRLLPMVANQGPGWLYASLVLEQTRDDRIVPFYITLLKDNYFAKEADGTRVRYGLGSPNDCIVMPHLYGGVLARALGNMRDPRAIPVLKEAAAQGDAEVKRKAYDALYKLGSLSLDDLFRLAKEKPDPQVNFPSCIFAVGGAMIHTDTRTAIKVFDRLITELPESGYEVAAAHYDKIQCYELLKQYDDALHECDEVMKFPEFDNLTSQMDKRRETIRRLAAGAQAPKPK